MQAYLCVACGTQFSATTKPPDRCAICEDDRQPVRREGQAWTTLEELRSEHRNELRELEPGLLGIGTSPRFAIGQRAVLIQTDQGNVLWDCIPLLDAPTAARVRELGGIQHIAISHPHYYSSMVEWAHEFGATIHLTASDREWVMRPDPSIHFWSGSVEPVPGVRVIQTGGHFAGAAVLHWQDALLTGDIIYVLPGRDERVSFMRSYPMLLPLSERLLDALMAAIEGLDYDRIYGAWWESVIDSKAKEVVRQSVELYRLWLRGGSAE
jgi:glyoxylase-like metal-dependent hydrolase (beta-lactamase superfamily II)